MYNVKWNVEEIVNGPGQHDDGVRDGSRRTIASGEVTKDAESAEVLRAELTAVLEGAYPRTGYGPTYDLDRLYNIDIQEAV